MYEYIIWLLSALAALVYAVREYIDKPKSPHKRLKWQLGLFAFVILFAVSVLKIPRNQTESKDTHSTSGDRQTSQLDSLLQGQSRQNCAIDSLRVLVRMLLATGGRQEFTDSVYEQAECVQSKIISYTAIDTAIILIGMQNYDESITHLDYSIMSATNDSIRAEAYFLRGLAKGLSVSGTQHLTSLDQKWSHRYHEALRDLDSSLHYRPISSIAWFNKAVVLIKLRQFEDALFCFDYALFYEPSMELAANARISLVYLLGEFAVNLSRLDDSLAEMHNNSALWLQRALTLFLLGRSQEALVNCDSAIWYDSLNLDAIKLRNIILEENK